MTRGCTYVSIGKSYLDIFTRSQRRTCSAQVVDRQHQDPILFSKCIWEWYCNAHVQNHMGIITHTVSSADIGSTSEAKGTIGMGMSA